MLNGFIQSLVGLYDFAQLTGDATARELFDAGDLAAKQEVPTFDTGAWSLYSRGSIKKESDLGYHKLLRDFLAQLCKRTATEQYCSANQHFTEYLTVPPVVEVLPRTLEPKKSGKLRFKLSKISRISVQDHAGDEDDRDDQPGRALPRDEDAGLDGAEEDRRLRDHGERHGPRRERGVRVR